MASIDPEHREDDEAAAGGEDEDTGAQVAPIVKLEEVAVTTGEEEEDAILDLKAKLYRFDKDGSQWKERGTGTVKLLKHKETGKVRLVMRQSKTLKICANHLVSPTMSVQEHAGNEKSCVWHATDFSDGELKDELFCIRFASVESKFFSDRVFFLYAIVFMYLFIFILCCCGFSFYILIISKYCFELISSLVYRTTLFQ
uniref:RanBD1 domain-containing protein n=1 Tax=Nelumbo nucifera TaxID=4432 RepID=A0A822Y0X0_NELNU|nr:TPA_asm: hypothetical protein HUJ06_027728 [Nelumbo nucifera]